LIKRRLEKPVDHLGQRTKFINDRAVIVGRAGKIALTKLAIGEFEVCRCLIGGKRQELHGSLKGRLRLGQVGLKPEKPAAAKLRLSQKCAVREALDELLQ